MGKLVKSNDGNIFNEIIDNKIVNLGFKNPQYRKEFYKLFWKKFLTAFEKNFSVNFEFSLDNISLKTRRIYVQAKYKHTGEKTLFILSMPEGQMKTHNNRVLGRLQFKHPLFKSYINDFNSIFFITFYAPLKMQIIGDIQENIINATDFSKIICVISGLQEFWNCSDEYGERYESVLLKKSYKKNEFISLNIGYNKILKNFISKPVITPSFITVINNKIINTNNVGNQKSRNSKSYDLIMLKDINHYIRLLIDKNNDFLKWAKYQYHGEIDISLETREIKDIEVDKTIKQTEREALIKSRTKQGLFRQLILEEFDCCIFTKIKDPRLLIASHIKPWGKSNNKERLNKNNGLLLSPMFDKLFDKGFISFTENGELLISSHLHNEISQLLQIKAGTVYELKLNDEKKEFIEFHKKNVFLG